MVMQFGTRAGPPQVKNRSVHLRAQGNLSYLDFIRVMEYLWHNAHPKIPFSASGLSTYPTYPMIVYSLIERQPQQNETKARVREVIPTSDTEPAILIKGQKFKNIVEFSVLSQGSPSTAEHLIELFEDFMLEYSPLLKEMGLSEIFYLRRVRDSSENRGNVDIVTRGIQYMVVTEKVYRQDVDKIQSILIDVRRHFEQRLLRQDDSGTGAGIGEGPFGEDPFGGDGLEKPIVHITDIYSDLEPVDPELLGVTTSPSTGPRIFPGLIATGSGLLDWISVRETSGIFPGIVRVWNNIVAGSGPLLWDVSVPPGGSREDHTGVVFTTGLYFEILSGQVELTFGGYHNIE